MDNIISANELRKASASHTPWKNRLYSINRIGTRSKRLLAAGWPETFQYVVTLPAELGQSLYEENTIFRWKRGRGGRLILEPMGTAERRGSHIRWTDEMIAKLRSQKKIGTKRYDPSDNELAAELGVTPKALRLKRYELNHA